VVTSKLDLRSWRADPQLWVELFVLFNFAGLVGDIYLAHSANQFRHRSEYVPLFFSGAAAAVLAVLLVVQDRGQRQAAWRYGGYLVGWLAVAIGLAGVLLHLDSSFFAERTLKSLTYAAPFAAPLAYAGLGLLLIVNRMVDPQSADWARWVLWLALGGFVGNFVFSLTDHAMNGFFHRAEWIPVASSAFAVSFLLMLFVVEVGRPYPLVCAGVLLVQALVGFAGFLLHASAVLRQPDATLFEKVLSGAPPMAPLLFPNLAVLGLIGLLALGQRTEARQACRPRAFALRRASP
jgi:hypothetical protein